MFLIARPMDRRHRAICPKDLVDTQNNLDDFVEICRMLMFIVLLGYASLNWEFLPSCQPLL